MQQLYQATAALALVSIVTTAGQAKDPAPLAPVSKWQMDYAPTECRLLRTFGEGERRTTIQFSQLDPRSGLQIGLVAPNVPTTGGLEPARVATTTVERVEVPGQGLGAQAPHPKVLQLRPNLRIREAIASDIAAGKPTLLQVHFKRFDTAIDLGSMKAPLGALDACVDDLVKSWGLDPAAQRSLASGPEPTDNPARWFTPEDYPGDLAQKGVGGAVVIRVGVSPAGAPVRCAVAVAGGDKAFEEATCRAVMARAQFKPALDRDSRPVASIWSVRVDWVAPSTRTNYPQFDRTGQMR